MRVQLHIHVNCVVYDQFMARLYGIWLAHWLNHWLKCLNSQSLVECLIYDFRSLFFDFYFVLTIVSSMFFCSLCRHIPTVIYSNLSNRMKFIQCCHFVPFYSLHYRMVFTNTNVYDIQLNVSCAITDKMCFWIYPFYNIVKCLHEHSHPLLNFMFSN